MEMKIVEAFQAARSAFRASLRNQCLEDARFHIRGDVFLKMWDGQTGQIQEEREFRNLIVLDASILLARLMKDNAEPPKGAFVLAVGTGDVGWSPMSPPAATNTQRAIYSEVTRKTFSDTQFINSVGVPVGYPTKTVDFTTTFTESEAVGPLVEMGLIGGNIDTNMSIKNPVSPPNGPYDDTEDLTSFETSINYLTFPVVNKPATSTLQIVWRLTF
jgi:hypothetical protein